MKIKTLTIELREITAEEGKILTNGEIFSGNCSKTAFEVQ